MSQDPFDPTGEVAVAGSAQVMGAAIANAFAARAI